MDRQDISVEGGREHGPLCITGSLRTSRCESCQRRRADVTQRQVEVPVQDRGVLLGSRRESRWLCRQCAGEGRG